MMTNYFQKDISIISSIQAVPHILDVVCRVTGMGFSAIARVTEDRWVACSVRDNIDFGLKAGGELKVETTICDEIRKHGNAVIISHVAEDEAYRSHHTPAMYGIQSYISTPIILSGGRFFGTLCAIDPAPAKLDTPEVASMFKLFAELIAFHIEAHEKLSVSETSLSEERELSELREQFIAVMSHDLRNPLAALSSGVNMLNRMPHEPRASQIISMMAESVGRMSSLINNVMDYAKSKLGGGLSIVRDRGQSLQPVLEHVIAEFRASHPDRVVKADIRIDGSIDCDGQRIAQMFSNLLGNAMNYGNANMPVHVRAANDRDRFELSVANAGAPIAPEVMERLFLPYVRGDVQPTQKGLGLGLYIASQIAGAHGGTLDVVSNDNETKFTFKMAKNS
ncbi:MAG: GAF domain-containing sensor histidine kinase [Pseudomonadota bacterium]